MKLLQTLDEWEQDNTTIFNYVLEEGHSEIKIFGIILRKAKQEVVEPICITGPTIQLKARLDYENELIFPDITVVKRLEDSSYKKDIVYGDQLLRGVFLCELDANKLDCVISIDAVEPYHEV